MTVDTKINSKFNSASHKHTTLCKKKSRRLLAEWNVPEAITHTLV